GFVNRRSRVRVLHPAPNRSRPAACAASWLPTLSQIQNVGLRGGRTVAERRLTAQRSERPQGAVRAILGGFMDLKSRLLIAALAVALAGAGASALAQGTDVVKVSDGTLQGTGRGADGVRRSLGVPFAQPPVGDLRWKEPQRVKPWQGVRPASQFGNRCMQAVRAFP